LPILSTPETTEVIYGVESIISKVAKTISELKDCADACWDAAGPSAVVTTAPVRKALIAAAQRGIRLRGITDITTDNISYCKMMIEDGHHLRHLPELKTTFGINDRMEYMCMVIVEEKKAPAQYIVSNVKRFVEGQQSLYDTLWSRALPAEQRIREIEEGLKPEFTETIIDPTEIQKRGFDLVKSAKEEITILFSTANGFKRQERAGLIRLLQETDPTVKVRILLPVDSAMENTTKDKFYEDRRIEIRYFLKSTPQTLLTTLTTDKKLCLVIELKDDTKDNSFEAVRSATYSNSESIVWTHASIFETLWMQAELARRRIDQRIS
jgi:hypothetical protein